MPRSAAQVTPIRPAEKGERFSVTLFAAAATALGRLTEMTRLSKSDVVNRSLQVYAFLAEQMEEGRTVMLRDPEGNLERVHIV